MLILLSGRTHAYSRKEQQLELGNKENHSQKCEHKHPEYSKRVLPDSKSSLVI